MQDRDGLQVTYCRNLQDLRAWTLDYEQSEGKEGGEPELNLVPLSLTDNISELSVVANGLLYAAALLTYVKKI